MGAVLSHALRFANRAMLAGVKDVRYAYVHGFASSSRSRKGLALASRFRQQGAELLLPDLNRPSFARLSHDACLEGLDELAGAAGTMRLVGSSFGGWLSARWAQLHPGRVDRLLLLCPGFHLAQRWPELLGDDQLEAWRRGEAEFPDAEGRPVRLHYAFYEEALRQPPEPEVPCPTRIIHGRGDEVVPIDRSRRYAAARDHVELIEVDDDHGLMASLDIIWAEITEFLLTDP